MVFNIPDYANAPFVEQAGPDSVDFDVLTSAIDQESGFLAGSSNLQVTQRAAGANMSVDVSAGFFTIGGGIGTTVLTNVALTADATNPRWALVVVNQLTNVVSATLGTAVAVPVMPAIPSSSMVLAAVWIPAAAVSILNANIVDKRFQKGSSKGVFSASSLLDAQYVLGRTASEAFYGIAGGTTSLSDAVAGDATFRLADTTKSYRWGFGPGGVSSLASDMQLSAAALTLPSGQTLTTGTRSVVTGTRATTTNASDTVDLGTFATTGGAIELRIHAHLAAPAAGSTASVTKVYEIAASSLMGTAATFYKVLPADMSANQATTNDFALEVNRTLAGTFLFRFRQISIGVAGSITFVVESLGDTTVVFTPSTTVTASPALITAIHPSNGLVAAAGFVGIGTDAPAFPLDVLGTGSTLARLVGTSAALAQVGVDGATGTMNTGVVNTAGNGFTDSASGDGYLSSGIQTLRIGVGAGASTLRVTSTDVQINDSGTARSVPRGHVFDASLAGSGAVSAATVFGETVPVVSGRRYRVTYQIFDYQTTVANDRFTYTLSVGGANTGTSYTVPYPATLTGGNSMTFFFTAGTTGNVTVGLNIARPAGTGTVTLNTGSMFVEDIGT